MANLEGDFILVFCKHNKSSRYCPNPGDIVLDNACGSGSFLLSALIKGRKFIRIEKNENVLLHKVQSTDYIKVCRDRIEEASQKPEREKLTQKLLEEPIPDF